MASITIRSTGIPKGPGPARGKTRRVAGTFPLNTPGLQEHGEFVAPLEDVDTRFYVRYRVNGAPRRESFRNKTAALNRKKVLEADKLQGNLIDPNAGKVTLRAYAERWLAERKDLKQTTRSKYEGLLDRHILPTFGAHRIRDITVEEVATWFYNLKGNLPPTAADAYRLLHCLFATAVRQKRLPDNPCQVPGAGQIASPERPIATISDIATATIVVPANWLAAFVLAVWCGLRRGEVLGLQRQDIDLDNRLVIIRRSWVKPDDGEPYESTPKSAKGWRTIAIPEHVIQHLSSHLDGTGKAPDAWLFPNPAGTSPVRPRQFDRVWESARRAIGRPDLRLHDLRHTGLTWVAATGATTADIMRRGGHSTTSAALRYQHSSQARDREIADALSRLATSADAIPRLEPCQECVKDDSDTAESEATGPVPTGLKPVERKRRGSSRTTSGHLLAGRAVR